MMEKLYVVQKKVAGSYPDGRYICTLLTGKVFDYYIVKAVLEYPSVRAVANDKAWSNAVVEPYGKLFYADRNALGYRKFEEYDGVLTDLSEKEYDLSLVKAIGEAIEKYKEKGDDEAVERLSEELGKVMEKREAA